MDFEEPAHPWDAASRLLPESEAAKEAQRNRRKGKRGGKKEPKEKKPEIPRLPDKEVAVITGDEVRRGVSDRARAAANLKVEGYTYAEIADKLEFESPQDAKRAVESVLAAIHGPGDYETLRLIATARLEAQIKRTTAMAGADFLVLEDGSQVPNVDKLRWHQAASTDIMNWAIVTGAKAPTKVEITPDEAALERLVAEIATRTGHEDIIEVDVLELTQVPEPDYDDDDEG